MFSKRRAPSCDSEKLHSQRPGESESGPGRRVAHVLTRDHRGARYQIPATRRRHARGPVQQFGTERQNAALRRQRRFLASATDPSFTSTILSCAVVPIRSLTRAGSSTPGSSTRISDCLSERSVILHRRLGQTERVDAALDRVSFLRNRVALEIDQRARLHVHLVVGRVDRRRESSRDTCRLPGCETA